MDRQKEYKFENKMKDCLAYFRLSPVWEKVLKGFREKYISYGRFGGKVILKNLKPTDIEELEGFFGKSFHSQKSVTVSAEKFRQALETSRYKEITPECLLENFFEEPLLGRQEQKSLREQEKECIWKIFQRDYEGTPVETALESLRSIVKDNGNQELAKWDRTLRLGAEIYNNLPYRNTKMYLAVFAAMRTGNPHAFDIGTADGNFLYQIIQMDLEIRRITVETSAIFPAYKRQKSYLLAGIMLDDVSNYTMLYQGQAVKKDGTYHKGMAGFCERTAYCTGSSCSAYRMGVTSLSPKRNIYCGKSFGFCHALWKRRSKSKRKSLYVYERSAKTGGFDGIGFTCKIRNPSLLCRRSGSGRCVDRTETFAVL